MSYVVQFRKSILTLSMALQHNKRDPAIITYIFINPMSCSYQMQKKFLHSINCLGITATGTIDISAEPPFSIYLDIEGNIGNIAKDVQNQRTITLMMQFINFSKSMFYA